MQYFFIKDLLDKGALQVEHCPTDQMDADYVSKATQGELFAMQRQKTMNLPKDSNTMVKSKLQTSGFGLRIA